jgi:spermidine synthase
VLPLIVFFLSGFAALLYQVIWQRLLVIFSGADVYSVTVIVAAFMAGLGTGSLVGGHLADRFGARRNLYAFAGAELVVGLFGLISKWLYYDTLYQQHSQLGAMRTVAAVVLFVTLLLPTFFMGVSLPLLARGLVRSVRASPRLIALLYASNTLGAAVGAFTAPWVLIPRFGLERSLWLAAAVNLICAVMAVRLGISQRDATRNEAPGPDITQEDASTAQVLPFRMWVALYGLTGFIALGLEIAWFRLLGVLLKSTSFTFGAVLAVYLAGLGVGAVVGARTVGRSRRPGATFLMLQYGITFYAALSVTALVMTLGSGHPIKLVRFLGSYEPVNVYETFARTAALGWFNGDAVQALTELAILYIVVPAILVGPPTLLMGLSFPYLQKASQSDLGRLGRRLGTLLASNIAGGVIGTVLTGWFFLPLIGTAGTLKTLVGVSAVLVWPFARLVWHPRRRLQFYGVLAAAGVMIVAALAMPTSSRLWAPLHAARPVQVLFNEDSAGLSLLKFDRASAGSTVEVYVNGLGQSWLPYGNIHTALGALPAFIHPAPSDVAIIGLGSADTALGAAGRADIQRLVSIEILGAQRRTLERFLHFQRYPGLVAVLSDPRIEHRVDDGRAYLNHGGRSFDVIEADALRPSSAYAGNLYSREYFALVRRHLKAGGFGVTWAPTQRIRDTFLSVFPHVLGFIGDIYIGSDVPIPFDAGTVVSRLADARYYYASAGVDIATLLRPYLESTPRAFGPGDARRSSELNTDMFPRDEFALPFW